jgi:hypothetical protein
MRNSALPQAKMFAAIPALRASGKKAPEKIFVDFPV